MHLIRAFFFIAHLWKCLIFLQWVRRHLKRPASNTLEAELAYKANVLGRSRWRFEAILNCIGSKTRLTMPFIICPTACKLRLIVLVLVPTYCFNIRRQRRRWEEDNIVGIFLPKIVPLKYPIKAQGQFPFSKVYPEDFPACGKLHYCVVSHKGAKRSRRVIAAHCFVCFPCTTGKGQKTDSEIQENC